MSDLPTPGREVALVSGAGRAIVRCEFGGGVDVLGGEEHDRAGPNRAGGGRRECRSGRSGVARQLTDEDDVVAPEGEEDDSSVPPSEVNVVLSVS